MATSLFDSALTAKLLDPANGLAVVRFQFQNLSKESDSFVHLSCSRHSFGVGQQRRQPSRPAIRLKGKQGETLRLASSQDESERPGVEQVLRKMKGRKP